ncbi:hypothetical protein [Runella slithyformis]|uniref:Sialate O-acetylesterase domain-containing protein n=1 Tax=Runella slithyformis (strain ATCC 29530 / DSM 19594 / LMG 11500 / NCIMB 11436 / LSU 4) TaxID=761193 RepID=A0A7U3ZI75_RUNSL|nr:hypothetical protein [Runella slithyformis]AEI47682.1 hypothetical protein Runsl_1255 [Runella slithyformis DSM 19594]
MITITYPYAGMVFQRDNSGAAYVNVRGLSDSAEVTIQFTPVQAGWGNASVTPKKVSVDNGQFNAWVKVSGGDYTLNVTDTANANNTAQLTPIGVGEVLMLWGHSFIAGDPGYNADATDSRSRSVTTARNPANSAEPSRLQNLDLLPLEFGRITNQRGIGPFTLNVWMWGTFADEMVKRLNVPVLLYGASFGGSQVYMNLLNIEKKPFPEPFFGGLEAYGMPYRPVEAVMLKYAKLTGLRGVICEHGGNDVGLVASGQINMREVFSKVVNYTRGLLGHQRLIWTVSLEGKFLGNPSTVLNDQLIDVLNTLPYTYKGIDLNQPDTVGSFRDDGGIGHFRGVTGAEKYLEMWLNAIKSDFFTGSVPYVINPPIGSANTELTTPVSSLLANIVSDSNTPAPRWWQTESFQWAALVVWVVGLVSLAGLFVLKTLKAGKS